MSATYKYSWTKHYGVDPQVAGPIVQRCGSAQALIDEARKRSSPLHGCFTWEDSENARKYLLICARTMISSLQVEVITLDRPVRHVQAFVSKVDRSGFVPTLEADAEQLGAAERRCIAQMKAFQARWRNLEFAREVVVVIADKLRDAQRVTRRPKTKKH